MGRYGGEQQDDTIHNVNEIVEIHTHTQPKPKIGKGALKLFNRLNEEVTFLRELQQSDPLHYGSPTWDCVCYRLIKIGEILKNLPGDKRELLVMDDKRIMDCRDMLAHNYKDIDAYEVRLVLCMCTKDMYDKLQEIL